MVFTEDTTDTGFVYKTNDSIGELEIHSPKKFDAEYLDDVYYAIEEVSRKNPNKVIDGNVQGTGISYKLVKTNPWQDNE